MPTPNHQLAEKNLTTSNSTENLKPIDSLTNSQNSETSLAAAQPQTNNPNENISTTASTSNPHPKPTDTDQNEPVEIKSGVTSPILNVSEPQTVEQKKVLSRPPFGGGTDNMRRTKSGNILTDIQFLPQMSKNADTLMDEVQVSSVTLAKFAQEVAPLNSSQAGPLLQSARDLIACVKTLKMRIGGF